MDSLPYFADRAKWLMENYPTLTTLIVLMVADFVTGLIVAIATKSLSSSVSFVGMCKKSMILILWGVAAIVEPILGIPLGRMVALAFIVTEALSIVENAAKLGVPVPAILVDTLIKVKTSSRPVPLNPPIVPVVETHIYTDRAKVDVKSPEGSKSATITIEPEGPKS